MAFGASAPAGSRRRRRRRHNRPSVAGRSPNAWEPRVGTWTPPSRSRPRTRRAAAVTDCSVRPRRLTFRVILIEKKERGNVKEKKNPSGLYRLATATLRRRSAVAGHPVPPVPRLYNLDGRCPVHRRATAAGVAPENDARTAARRCRGPVASRRRRRAPQSRPVVYCYY